MPKACSHFCNEERRAIPVDDANSQPHTTSGRQQSGSVMRIDHIALWTDDIDRCKAFYATYFGARGGRAYVNAKKGFESCFLEFDNGSRIEIMKTTTLDVLAIEAGAERMGLTHFAISLGTEQLVDDLTKRLKQDGYPVLGGPRRTGDGYYESVVLDPDGNRVEITA